jgi:hypothetical protein
LDGEWFVLKKGYPVCELVPKGCPVDGKHFYGTPANQTMANHCWELLTQGPCAPNQKLKVKEGEEKELILACTDENRAKNAIKNFFGSNSMGKFLSCPLGTIRDINGICRRRPIIG